MRPPRCSSRSRAHFEMYEPRYSEALAVVSALLPTRVDDFKSFYKSSGPVKEITARTYSLSGYALGRAPRRIYCGGLGVEEE